MRDYAYAKWYCVCVLQALVKALLIWPTMLLTAVPAKLFDGAQALLYAVDDWWWD